LNDQTDVIDEINENTESSKSSPANKKPTGKFKIPIPIIPMESSLETSSLDGDSKCSSENDEPQAV
jgi:hypothetical protein